MTYGDVRIVVVVFLPAFSGHPDCKQVSDAKKQLHGSQKLSFIPVAKRADSVDAVCPIEDNTGVFSIK